MKTKFYLLIKESNLLAYVYFSSSIFIPDYWNIGTEIYRRKKEEEKKKKIETYPPKPDIRAPIEDTARKYRVSAPLARWQFEYTIAEQTLHNGWDFGFRAEFSRVERGEIRNDECISN